MPRRRFYSIVTTLLLTMRIEKLHRTHAAERFTCGQAELDRFLTVHALQRQQ
jgi:hypothetical protein